MNIYGIEILLIGMLGSVFGLTLIIYLGNIILNLFKISDSHRNQLNRSDSNAEASTLGKARRKIGLKPGVICSLPIHQERRREAPLY